MTGDRTRVIERHAKDTPNVGITCRLVAEIELLLPEEYVPPTPTTREVRLTRKLSQKIAANKAMADRIASERAFSDNRERLKADRLAREAAGPTATKETHLSK
jgi:hypothetical protein